MMIRECSLFAIAVLALACDQKPAAKRTPEPVSLVKPDAPPVAPAEAMYVYSPVAKRDPFQNKSADYVVPPPRPARSPTSLQKWTVDDFRVTFTLTGTATPRAVLEAPDQHSWLVGIGDYVGKHWGKVTAIERDQVTITETIGGPGGHLYPQPIKLLIAAPGDPGHGPVIETPGPSRE